MFWLLKKTSSNTSREAAALQSLDWGLPKHRSPLSTGTRSYLICTPQHNASDNMLSRICKQGHTGQTALLTSLVE